MMIFMNKKIKYDLVLKNGSVVLPEGIKTIDIGVINESIRDIGNLSGSDTYDFIDCSGLHVLPGVIDSQVHFREPGLENKENLESGMLAAAAGGVIAALLFAKLLFGKYDLSMSLNGAIGGLVSITAEPLTPSPELAAIIGAIGGILVVISIIVLDKSKIDDPVGAISAHGTCGIWGLIAVVFSNTSATLTTQLYGVITIFSWTFIMALIFWGILKAVIGIRVSSEEEHVGVDVAECGMEAYPEFVK